MKWSKSVLYPIIVYLIGFAVQLRYSLVDYRLTSDSGREYDLYHYIVTTGKFLLPQSDSVLSTSLSTTWLPALIQRILHSDVEMTFKLYATPLIPLLPVAVFLIARRYFKPEYALVVSGFLISQIYFLWGSSFARTNIAITFFAFIVFIILKPNMFYKRKLLWLIPLTLGIVLSHYGTAFASLFILGVGLFIWSLNNPTGKTATLVSILLLSIFGVSWYYLGEATVLRYSESLIQRSFAAPTLVGPTSSFVDLDSRDPVIAVAFGKTLPYMNLPQRLEFVVTWLSILVLSYGLGLAIIRKILPIKLLVLAGASYIMILLTIIVPTISIEYGIARVYLHSLVILSTFFLVGIEEIAKRTKLSVVTTSLLILTPLALSTSGLTYLVMGLSR